MTLSFDFGPMGSVGTLMNGPSFTSKGTKYFHQFNISLCGGEVCEDPASLNQDSRCLYCGAPDSLPSGLFTRAWCMLLEWDWARCELSQSQSASCKRNAFKIPASRSLSRRRRACESGRSAAVTLRWK
ncbi:unnamed protein product [Arctogadus glacialis]